MQTIETKYAGPSNTKPSRIIATASGSGTRVTVSYDSALSDEDAHMKAARELREAMNWRGEMIGGHTKSGMVWVFADNRYRMV